MQTKVGDGSKSRASHGTWRRRSLFRSSMSAKTHTHGTNREKPHKSKDQEKKVVFKSVLDNPFRIRWHVVFPLLRFLNSCHSSRPSVPVNMQNLILAQIISLLEDLSTYNRTRSDESRKRKREAHTEQAARKKQKTGNEANAPNQESTAMEMEADLAPAIDSSNPSSSTKHPPPAPRIQKHLVVGINAVTKRLEYQIQKTRHTVTVSTSSLSTPSTDLPLPSIKYLFVCRADVDPPILIDHLPHLVASYNSAKPSDPIKLVPLPKGAEFTLAECLNVRRVAAFALDVSLSSSKQTVNGY